MEVWQYLCYYNCDGFSIIYNKAIICDDAVRRANYNKHFIKMSIVTILKVLELVKSFKASWLYQLLYS